MNRSIIAIICVFCLASISQAQDQKKIKFGKIDMDNLKMTVYPLDSTAKAVVLADQGTSELKYDQENGFYLSHTRHKRVKILTKDGYDEADVSVYLYERGGDREKLSGFKAATYNLVKGKMKASKLGKNSKFEEKYNDNYTIEKWTFPDVREGSIIEYTYTLRSDFIFNLQDWSFQSDIPAVWSEYIVAIPEYFTYKQFAQGYHAMTVNNTEMKRDRIIIKSKSRTGGDAGFSTTKTTFSQDEIPYSKTVYHWRAEKVPAFKEEPYMASIENFVSKINFELASTQFPGSPVKRYMGTWADVNKSFLDNESFGKAVDGSGFLKERVAGLTSGASSDLDKVVAIVNDIRSTMTWNGNYRKYVTNNLRSAVKQGEGSSADINLLLVNMLRKAGLKADPVLISTRSNGFVREQFALSSQFNFVICLVEVNGKTLLLDATDKSLPGNLLPQRDLNQRGWRVSASRPGWVDLTSGGRDMTIVTANLELTENGTLKGNTQTSYSDYAARRARVYHSKNKDEYQKKIEGDMGWQISDLNLEGEEELSKPFVMKADMESGNGVENLGQLIYINPFVSEQWEENPFKLEAREFPVDFISPLRENYMLTLKIPEGYEVDELPKNEMVTLPGGAGKFSYFMQQADNTISFRCTVSLTKTLFTGPEYPYLKQFFAKIVEKEAEQIVLKKKTE